MYARKVLGGSNAPSDSELTLESTTNPKVLPLVISPARLQIPTSIPTSSMKKKSSFLGGAFATNPPAEVEATALVEREGKTTEGIKPDETVPNEAAASSRMTEPESSSQILTQEKCSTKDCTSIGSIQHYKK